jgi:hypothetical protein
MLARQGVEYELAAVGTSHFGAIGDACKTNGGVARPCGHTPRVQVTERTRLDLIGAAPFRSSLAARATTE